MGQEKRVIQYGLEAHAEVLQWLKENTNHTYNIETQYNYEPSKMFPSGSAKISLYIDDATLGKLQKLLNPTKRKKNANKGMPPKQGW